MFEWINLQVLKHWARSCALKVLCVVTSSYISVNSNFTNKQKEIARKSQKEIFTWQAKINGCRTIKNGCKQRHETHTAQWKKKENGRKGKRMHTRKKLNKVIKENKVNEQVNNEKKTRTRTLDKSYKFWDHGHRTSSKLSKLCASFLQACFLLEWGFFVIWIFFITWPFFRLFWNGSRSI